MAGRGGSSADGVLGGAGSGLAVDTEELARVRARLEQVAADLAAAGARIAAADGMALGARRLVTAVERVQQDWGVHVRALRELADVAAQGLGAASAAYDACEAGAVARVGASGLAAPGTAVVPAPAGTPAASSARPSPTPQPAPPVSSGASSPAVGPGRP